MVFGRRIKRGLVSLLAVGALAGAISGCQPNNNPITTPPPTGPSPTEYATKENLTDKISVAPMDKWDPTVTDSDKTLIDFLVSEQNNPYFNGAISNAITFFNDAMVRFDTLDGYKMDAVKATIDYYNQSKALDLPLYANDIHIIRWPFKQPEINLPLSTSDPNHTGVPAKPGIDGISLLNYNSTDPNNPVTFLGLMKPTDWAVCNDDTEANKVNTSQVLSISEIVAQNYGDNVAIISPFYISTVNEYATYIFKTDANGNPVYDGSISFDSHPDHDLLNVDKVTATYTHVSWKNGDVMTKSTYPLQPGQDPGDSTVAFLDPNVKGSSANDFLLDISVITTNPNIVGVRLANQSFTRADIFYPKAGVPINTEALLNSRIYFRHNTDGSYNLSAISPCAFSFDPTTGENTPINKP